jgi:uncharacterized protein YceH (UPF0502 family)
MLDFTLTLDEVRVLGCLIEKEMTTPDYYPLSVNALQNACNQSSNRNPVVSYDERTVITALDKLKEKGFVSPTLIGRVPKYEELFLKRLNLVRQEVAVLCVLMLRGQQTIGEIRIRTERIYSFENLDAVHKTLTTLEEWGYVTLLPRQHGRKDQRYAQLFSGPPVIEQEGAEEEEAPSPTESARLLALESEVVRLRLDVDGLKQAIADFKSQFE